MTLALHHAATAHHADWIPLQMAAKRMGCNAENLARRCRNEFAPSSLAEKRGPAWFISPAADPRLRDRIDAKQRDLQHEAELAAQAIDPKYIEQARAARDILIGFESFEAPSRATAREALDAYLASLRASNVEDVPSITTFYDWSVKYNADGLRGLISRHAFRAKSESAAGIAALDYIEMLMNAGNSVTLNAAIQIARGEALKHPNDPAWHIAGYTTIRLAIKARRPKILRVLTDKGPRAAKAHCMPKMQRDFESIAAGDEYVGDERHLDLWCRVLMARGWKAIRPWITVWNDMRSRCVVGLIVGERANSSTINGALKRAILAYGKPRSLRTDHGRDYKKAARHGEITDADGEKFSGILHDLGIEVRRVAPYTPWAKPIESFFKTMKEQMDSLFGGFWGGCPSERNEDRAAYIKKNLEKLPTLDDVSAALHAFIDVYHSTPHSAADLFGKTPLEAMAAFRDGPIRRETESTLNHLFKEFVGPKMVRRDGVRHHSRWYGNGDPRLVAMQGQRVLLAIQPDDQGRAEVCEVATKRPLFTIECLSISGLSREEIAALHRERRKLLLPYAEAAKAGRTYLRNTTPKTLLDTRLRGIRAQRGDSVPDEGPSLTVVRPAMEEAIEKTGPAPSDDVSSKAVRTGTDRDEITVHDMIHGDPVGRASLPAADDDAPDFFGVDDLEVDS